MSVVCLSEERVRHILYRLDVFCERLENDAKYYRKVQAELRKEIFRESEK